MKDGKVIAKYYFDDKIDDFILVNEDQNFGGNFVLIRSYHEGEGTPPSYQFDVNIDDFAYVIAALNRLVRKYIPGFVPF